MFPLLFALVPSLVRLVGGAVKGSSPAVDAALNVVQNAVGSPINSLDDVEKALTKFTPEQRLALQQCEASAAASYNAAVVSLAQAEVDDTVDARNTYEQTKSWTPAILSYMVIALIIFIFVCLFTQDIPKDNEAMVTVLITLIAREMLPFVMKFWFGALFDARTKDLKQ